MRMRLLPASKSRQRQSAALMFDVVGESTPTNPVDTRPVTTCDVSLETSASRCVDDESSRGTESGGK